MLLICVLLMVIPSIISERIILLDLPPEQAQKYISGRGLDVSYARLLDEGRLSNVADDKQKYYYRGELIENPDDYMQAQYEANQFQAQDGLGRSMFGYSDWNQGRLEARNANGEVRGSYQFVDPNGDNVVVNYWSDSLGFHQMDNQPKAIIEPVTETDEVREARLAHARAWEAAAKAALENPDPLSDQYNKGANRLEDESAEIKEIVDELNGKRQSRESEERSIGDGDDDTVAIEAHESKNEEQVRKLDEDNIETLDEQPAIPRGFYYNFDYPVNLISLIEGSRKIKRSDGAGIIMPRIGETDKPDQVALEAEPRISIVTAEQPHPTKIDENVLVVDAIKVFGEDLLKPKEVILIEDKPLKSEELDLDLTPPKENADILPLGLLRDEILLAQFVPEADILDKSIPLSSPPEQTIPKESIAEKTETLPENTIPADIHPIAESPEKTTSAETLPEKTVSTEPLPEKTISAGTLPEKMVSTEVLPEKTISAEIQPIAENPEKTISAETLPEKMISTETLPEKTISTEALPVERLSTENRPNVSVPEKTVPVKKDSIENLLTQTFSEPIKVIEANSNESTTEQIKNDNSAEVTSSESKESNKKSDETSKVSDEKLLASVEKTIETNDKPAELDITKETKPLEEIISKSESQERTDKPIDVVTSSSSSVSSPTSSSPLSSSDNKVKLSQEPELIPVAIQMDEIPNIQLKSTSSKEYESELRKLATNEYVIDAVHDAQIHPKQLLTIEQQQ